MKRSPYFNLTLLCLFLFFTADAQVVALKNAPEHVKIDGNIAEWQGYEEATNEKIQVTYIVSNDKDNLYLVLRTKDPKIQRNILGAGIKFSVDPKGRKKSTFATTFPEADAYDLSEFENMEAPQLAAKAKTMPTKKIKAEGIIELPEYLAAQKNEHNILVSIAFTPEGELIYEEAIPMQLITANVPAGKEWAFNIKINGLFKKPLPRFGGGDGDGAQGGGMPPVGGGGGGRRGGGGAGGRVNPAAGGAMTPPAAGSTTQITPSSDFWVKFTPAP